MEVKEPKIYEWLFIKEIGQGATSHVYLCRNTTTNEYAAAKIYNSIALKKCPLGGDEPPIIAVQREISIMCNSYHRYILSLIEVIEDEYTSSYILFLQLAENGTLHSLLNSKKITESSIAICFFQIAEAFRYIHSKNIVHRDLKPENILSINDQYFVLSDFGVSAELKSPDELLADTQGSPAFLSPEECSGTPFAPKPADVWAYGVTLYVAVFGCLPFNIDAGEVSTSNPVMTVTRMLAEHELSIPEPNSVNPHAIELLNKCLDKDPTKRPTFEEIVQNPWFEEGRKIDTMFMEEEDGIVEEEMENEEPNVNQLPSVDEPN